PAAVALEQLRDRAPAPVHARVVAEETEQVLFLDLQPGPGQGRESQAAVREDLGGDALHHLWLMSWPRQKGHVRVGVDVADARRHHLARGVDLPARLRRREAADAGDLSLLDSQVTPEARLACAIDDRRVSNDDVHYSSPAAP